MFVCKICGVCLKRGSVHVNKIHNMKGLEYVKEYEKIDCCELYLKGCSGPQIAKIIKEKTDGFSPIKKDIIVFLRENEIEIRTNSEAQKELCKRNGGPWNKGLTKDDHPSIMKYAKNRRGKSNPYWNMTEKEHDEARNWYNSMTEKEKKES